MGGIRIKIQGIGDSPEDALRKLQYKDRNGDFYDENTLGCHVGNEVKTTEELENTDEKGRLNYIVSQTPRGNDNKVKSKVINFPNKGTRKWITKYVVMEHTINYGKIELSSDVSQTEAVKKARKIQEESPDKKLSVHIIKDLQGDTKVAEIEYKPSSKERPGIYLFGGITPY